MRWILRFRIFIIISLAVVLISAAVIFSVLRAVLPYATGYKSEIQQELSQEIGLPVEIDSIDAAIHWFSPRLKLIGISVYDEKNKVPLFNFREAFVELDVISSILRREIIVDDVGLIGADISIEKLSDNEWLVQGIKFTSEGSSELPEQFLYMLQNSNYLLHDSNIYYQDHTGDKLNLSLLDVNIDVKNDFNNHDIKFTMKLPELYGDSLAVVANLQGDRDSLDGNIYIEAQQVNVKQWNEDFNFLKTHRLDAVIDINLWITLYDNNIQTLFAQLNSRNVSLQNKVTTKSWETNYLSTNVRYAYEKNHWNIAISDFYFGDEARPVWNQKATILASDDDDYYYLSADFLRLHDLQDIAEVALSGELLSDFEKLKSYQVESDIFNLNLQLMKDRPKERWLDNLYLEASVVDFSMHDAVHGINVSGLDASLHYNKKQAVIDVATQHAQIEIKNLFRDPLFAENVQGKLLLHHDENNWQLKTDQLQLKNNHINTFSRLDIQFSSAENIFVDIQTDFYDAYGKYARHYLPVGIMSPALVNWLDMAVTDGYVPNGIFVLHGNLNDFPYNDHNGVFQVLFYPQDVSLKFLQQWPLLTDTSAIVKFNNSSLAVYDVNAKSQGASLFHGYAEIINLTEPVLTVTTEAHGKNEDMQSYVWSSPLDNTLGGVMRLFQLKGESDLSLRLDVPLKAEKVDVTIDGHLNFIDTEIYYPEVGYAISDAYGVLDFTQDSVFINSMKAKIQNNLVLINAFTQIGNSGREVVFQMDGVMDVDYLLQRYSWVPEHWISGQSKWLIDIEVPYQPKDYLTHIKARSYLENVALQVSDKVHKSADKKVDFIAEIDVLDGNGLHLDAKAMNDQAEDIFSLYAVRNKKSMWNFDIKSKYITGKGDFTEGLDKDTQITLDLDNIDLHALFFSENERKSQPLNPSDFPPLNLKAKNVSWDHWPFTDVKLVTDWYEHGMLINALTLHGPAMTFNARGTWLKSWRNVHETVLQGDINSSNLGETLTGLGFERSINRSKFKATFNSKWPAEPYGLSLANMKGKTAFELEKGEILEVNPGAGGRILGLLNIFKLTNRLAFDFDDVTREGFSFDTIKGDFEFVDGDGSLKNFDVSAPAADINMFGSIGMVKRDYGLLMRVKPHTDSLTFAGGTLLGGVVVGAGLALIQKVFDLGIIGHNVYSITGSWDDPKIEKIVERDQTTTEEDDF
jgi:uncharacterized protein YhdP